MIPLVTHWCPEPPTYNMYTHTYTGILLQEEASTPWGRGRDRQDQAREIRGLGRREPRLPGAPRGEMARPLWDWLPHWQGVIWTGMCPPCSSFSLPLPPPPLPLQYGLQSTHFWVYVCWGGATALL